jgi:predicted secreted protein
LDFYFLEEEFPVIEQDAASSHLSPSQLDELTSGAFSASTSTERAQRLRAWIDSNPSMERMQEVFKEMSARDKGAAKTLREKIDELKKLRAQEALTQDWVSKAELILNADHLNLVDALAWVRDAAKAGAPLSKEPLAQLKSLMAEKIKRIEDLEHRSQVQREAAVLLAQRIEVLSTKPWQDALAQQQSLEKDVKQWFVERDQITADALWASVDPKHSPLMLNSGQQLQAVWDAFDAALLQTQKASLDASEAPPLVPAWAEQIKATRTEASPQAAHAPRAKVDPEQKAKATEVVQGFLRVLEGEVSQGHGKASASAALDLKNALRENARFIDEKLEQHAQSVLAAANELEGWQRWRADQIRSELLAKAEGLFKRVPSKTQGSARVTKVTRAEGKKKIIAPEVFPEVLSQEASEGAPSPEHLDSHLASQPVDSVHDAFANSHGTTEPQEQVESATHAENAEAVEPSENAETLVQEIRTPLPQEMTWVPVVGGRKMQEILRDLREQWKQTDQGGLPNHALWKKFDQACNRAYKVVEVWQEKVKKEGAEHKAQRLALIEEVRAFAQTKAQGPEWKAIARQLHQYSERWRESGHVSERVFAELQPMWKEVMRLAHEPLEKVQAASIEKRQALIEEAKVLGAESNLRIDAVKNLQQRWQQESQSVLLDRKQEQKLWDLFREPIDAAFNRKTQQREQNMAALSAHDEAVVRASKALEEAVRLEDAKLIKERMQTLDAALRGQSAAQSEALKEPVAQPAQDVTATASVHEAPVPSEATSDSPQFSTSDAVDSVPHESSSEAGLPAEGEHSAQVQSEKIAASPTAKAPAKPVVAVRGDDRPGQKPGLAQSPVPSKDARALKGGFARGPKDSAPGKGRREFEGHSRPSRFEDAPRGPRLSDAAFRAQRQAVESAQQTLRKLSAMAHGESLMQLMSAWEHRDAQRVPALRDLSTKLSPADRQLMVQSLETAPKSQNQAATSMLRLEMASEVPTPAQFLSDRRALQLQLLTRRNDPSPVQTWTKDVAQVLEAPFDAQVAQRLQNTLKVLLKN